MSTTFSRNSTAYLPDGTLVNTNLPRFVPGRFGQAIMVEEGTTNLLTANQSSIETDLTGFTAWAGGTTLTRDVSVAWTGGASVRADCNGIQMHQGIQVNSTAVPASATYTVSVWLRGSGNVVFELAALGSAMDLRLHSFMTITLTSVWTRHTLSLAFDSLSVNARILVITPSAQAITFWADGIQLEQKPFATTWQIGGTPRVNEVLSLNTANVNPVEGTIEFWWTPINLPVSLITPGGRAAPIITVGHWAIPNSWLLRADFWERLQLLGVGDGGTMWSLVVTVINNLHWYVLNQPVHFAVTWQSTIFNVYVNGVRHGPFTSTHPMTAIAGNSIWLGELANALFDDVRITSRVRTPAEILANFNSNQPAPVDAQMNETVWVLPWNNSLASNVTVVRQGQSGIDVVPRGIMTPVMGIVGTHNVAIVPSLAKLDHYVPLAAIPIANRVAQFSVPIEPVVDFTIRSEGG